MSPGSRLPGVKLLIAVLINIALVILCQRYYNITRESQQSQELLLQQTAQLQHLEELQRQIQDQLSEQAQRLTDQTETTNQLTNLAFMADQEARNVGARNKASSNRTQRSFQVPEELHKSHDIAIPRDIPEWTEADTAYLETITGFDMMTQLLKPDYSRTEELKETYQIDFTNIGRAERMYKSLWSHVYAMYKVLPHTRDPDKERALRELARTHSEVDFFLRLERRLFPWLHLHRKTAFSHFESFEGKGFVICAGNGQFEYTVASIQAIRNKLKSDLPIQVFYISWWDLSVNRRNFLTRMTHDVEVVDISDVLDNDYMKLGGWSIKSFAILASKFEEAILIDADVFFLRKPEELFSDPGYNATGALFFYDRSLGGAATASVDWVKSISPFLSNTALNSRMFRGLSDHEQESGVVVINKKKRFQGLLAVCKMNSKFERDLYAYQKFYGDKETFWSAFEMIQEPYAFMRSFAGVIGELGEEDKEAVCGAQLHLDHQERPMWWNGGVMRNKNEGIKRDLEFGYWMAGGGLQEHRERIVKAIDPQRELLFDLGLKSMDEVIIDEPLDPEWEFKSSCLSKGEVVPLDKMQLSLANSYVRLDQVAKKILTAMETALNGQDPDLPEYDWENI